MPFIHLANGEVKKLSNDEMKDRYGDEVPVSFRDGNTESAIIGIYQDDVQIESETPSETPKTEPTEFPRKGLK